MAAIVEHHCLSNQEDTTAILAVDLLHISDVHFGFLCLLVEAKQALITLLRDLQIFVKKEQIARVPGFPLDYEDRAYILKDYRDWDEIMEA